MPYIHLKIKCKVGCDTHSGVPARQGAHITTNRVPALLAPFARGWDFDLPQGLSRTNSRWLDAFIHDVAQLSPTGLSQDQKTASNKLDDPDQKAIFISRLCDCYLQPVAVGMRSRQQQQSPRQPVARG